MKIVTLTRALRALLFLASSALVRVRVSTWISYSRISVSYFFFKREISALYLVSISTIVRCSSSRALWLLLLQEQKNCLHNSAKAADLKLLRRSYRPCGGMIERSDIMVVSFFTKGVTNDGFPFCTHLLQLTGN